MTMSRSDYQLSQLDVLEAESIHVMREVAAEFERPVLLFSGGKDSIVMLALAERAFAPARIPFPVMHVDTGHNFDEVLNFRDRRVDELGVRLIVASVQESIDSGRVVEETGRWASRNRLQTTTLLDALAEQPVRRGLRRCPPRRGEGQGEGAGVLVPRRVRPVGPEEPAPRAVEPVQHQDPPGRAHPGLPAVELDRARHLALHRPGKSSRSRPSTSPTGGRCSSATACCSPITRTSPAAPTIEAPYEAMVRYRTVGDISCTGAGESSAATLDEVIAEIAATRITERGPDQGRRPGQRGRDGGPQARGLLLMAADDRTHGHPAARHGRLGRRRQVAR